MMAEEKMDLNFDQGAAAGAAAQADPFAGMAVAEAPATKRRLRQRHRR